MVKRIASHFLKLMIRKREFSRGAVIKLIGGGFSKMMMIIEQYRKADKLTKMCGTHPCGKSLAEHVT